MPNQLRSVHVSRTATSLRDRAFVISALVLAFTSIVLPNSLRPFSFAVIGGVAAIALSHHKGIEFNFRFRVWLLSSIVTVFFVAIGTSQELNPSMWQTPFVYVVSPAMWLLICSHVLTRFHLSVVVRVILFFGTVAGTSVFIFYYAFLTFGPESLRWLIYPGRDLLPNLQYGDGNAAATMYVFGSLMFIAGGFFAAPQLIASATYKMLVASILVAAALLSGRTALMLSIALGAMVFVIGASRRSNKKLNIRTVASAIMIASFTVLVILTAAERFDFDLAKIIGQAVRQVLSGGGEGRIDQFSFLAKGILDTNMFGAGHGIGVDLVRNNMYPWRYELLWVATIYRVGLIGALIYCIPIAVVWARYGRQLLACCNRPMDDFMFGGFVAAFVGSATNPYYESFEFQWMLVLPFVYFTMPAASSKRKALQGTQIPEGARLAAASRRALS